MNDLRAMHLVTQDRLAAYLADDRFGALLERASRPGDERLTCQRWLLSTPPKRYSGDILYGDLANRRNLRILDIGGGLTAMTRLLAERHDYTLVDLMAHDAPETVSQFLADCPPFRVIAEDWAKGFPEGPFDVVIAADIFPNVDQRLARFLELARSAGAEIRMSLTWHDPPRQDLVRRVAGDEIMCMVGWTGSQILQALAPYATFITGFDPALFDICEPSVYPNGRSVGFVTIRRSLSEEEA